MDDKGIRFEEPNKTLATEHCDDDLDNTYDARIKPVEVPLPAGAGNWTQFDDQGPSDSAISVSQPIAPTLPPRFEDSPPSYVECTVDCPRSEEDVRTVLQDYVNSECCAGSRAANQMRIHEITPMHAFRYVLNTFDERRILKVKSEPLGNQYLDGPQNGAVPDKWSVGVQRPPDFTNSKKVIDLPNSAGVKKCHKCFANGFTTCTSCSGLGFSSCTWCNGNGRRLTTITTTGIGAAPMVPDQHVQHHHHHHAHHHHQHHPHNFAAPAVPVTQEVFETCSSCHGLGRNKCSWCELGQCRCGTCKGRKFLKYWQVLEISWVTGTETFETEHPELRRQMISGAQHGGIMFSEMSNPNDPRPLNCHIDPGIFHAARKLISKQIRTDSEGKKILKFKQNIEIIPVVKVTFEYKGNQNDFFIYGSDRRVHFPDGYPDSCSCCSIV